MKTQWVLLGVAVLVLTLFIVLRTGSSEGFEDVVALTTQRQQLQFEGERRYNPLARLQSPNQKIPATDMDAAITTALPVIGPAIGHPGKASLLDLIGSSLGLGAADDGSGKTGEWVEQTGVIQDKINFCESLTTVNCDLLQSDPRMRECGFCHRDGTNSKGKAHRGGLFISADDQIRANTAAEGGAATYQPTIGTCKPQNFTLMSANCQAREAQLQCQSAGAPMSSNPCGQCYGGKTPSNATGLLYVTPNKPLRHQVFLNVSHTGFYTGPNGYGLEVTYPNGAVVGLPAAHSPTSIINPPTQPLVLNLAEGDIVQITIYGPPAVFCGWLSNQSGTRSVSMDIGLQSMSPEGAYEIAGDKNSSVVLGNLTGAIPSSFMSSVPNTVLWYLRRNNVMLQSVVKAYYGNYGEASADVTPTVQKALARNEKIIVGTNLLDGAKDPEPGQTKALLINYDVLMSGTQFVDGQSIDATTLNTKVTFTFQMPATLIDPPLAADLADCPTGPLVLTEVGAGLMGSHSCFKPDGSFNPNAYCLQELFQAAGGTKQGTDWPATDAAAAKLVAPSGTLDDTVAALNRLGNIAIYGVDMNGAMVDFPTFKDAAMRMLGIAVKNPCDGPMSGTGPHSPECLDYLWRTMNNPGQDATPISGNPPYSGCSAAGLAAPLNADGSVNVQNVATANAQGGISSVRKFFQSLYNRTQNSADFDGQVAAMRDCYGTNIQPPVEPTSSCPTPAPNEWQCFTPDKLQQPEVFAVCPDNQYSVEFKDAETTCASYGARLATPAEVTSAQQSGAQWCSCAWATDGNAYYPMQQSAPGCGSPGMNSCGNMNDQSWEWANRKACVNCYGIKPPAGTTDVRGFSVAPDGTNTAWNTGVNRYIGQITSQGVPACRQGVPFAECASTDGNNITFFPSADACTEFVTTGKGPKSVARSPDVSDLVNKYLSARV